MLTNKQIEKIKETNVIALSTTDKNNQSRIIHVMPSKIEQNRIVVSNIQMQTTIKNIVENNKVFINYYSAEDELQIKITGTATIEDNSKEFYEVKKFEEENNLPENLKVKSIIIITIINVEESIG